jgi:hypothetical protein
MDAKATMPSPELDILLRELLLCAAEDIRQGTVQDALESPDCLHYFLDRLDVDAIQSSSGTNSELADALPGVRRCRGGVS